MRLSSTIAFLTILVFLLPACSREGEEILAPGAGAYPDLSATYVPMSADLEGYSITFQGRTFDGQTTTFSYLVEGTTAESVADMFFLEIPGCAPGLSGYSPLELAYIGTNPYLGIYGIKWEGYIYPGSEAAYTVTYPGDVPTGTVTTAVKVGETVASADIAGPCKGAVLEFEISGAVFVDADGDGTRDAADAAGIGQVTVKLVDASGYSRSFLTGPDGLFDFMVPAGTYSLRVPTLTDEKDFNEELAASFDATTPIATLITVGPDSPGNLFGFDPRAGDLTSEIDAGTIETTGQSSKFWIKHLRAAMRDRTNPKLVYDAPTMLGFLTEIEGLLLEEPFQFTEGSEFEEAIEILKGGSPQPEKALLRELLTAELNHVSGRGMVERPILQLVMLAWVEEIVYDIWNPQLNDLASSERTMLELSFGDAEVDEAISFLESLNAAIGGGSGGGG